MSRVRIASGNNVMNEEDRCAEGMKTGRDIDTLTFFDALVDVPIKFEITGENEQIVAYQRCVNVSTYVFLGTFRTTDLAFNVIMTFAFSTGAIVYFISN